MSETTILQRVEAVAPLVRAEAPASEAAGRLTGDVVDALRGAGVFGMTVSRELGGPQLPPPEQIEVIEALAAADGSAGWCGMINSDGGYLTAYFDRDVARALYPTPDLASVFVATPVVGARVKGDGYVLNGVAPFASGSTHADRFFVNCVISDDDGVRMAPAADGRPPMPETRVCALTADDVEVLLGTWQPTGLTATASHDFRVRDVFVPAERTFSLFEGIPVDPAPLYAWRWMFFVNMPGVPLGVARAALDEARQVAQGKVIFPDMTLARDDGTLQWNIGRAEALVASARAYVFDAVGRCWESICAGRDPAPAEWTAVRLAHTHAMQSCKEAVTLVYEGMGTTGVYRRSPIDRHLRDITTMAQHILGQTKTYANAGRSLLGVAPGGIAF